MFTTFATRGVSLSMQVLPTPPEPMSRSFRFSSLVSLCCLWLPLNPPDPENPSSASEPPSHSSWSGTTVPLPPPPTTPRPSRKALVEAGGKENEDEGAFLLPAGLSGTLCAIAVCLFMQTFFFSFKKHSPCPPLPWNRPAGSRAEVFEDIQPLS